MSFSLHRLRRAHALMWAPDDLRAGGILKADWCFEDLVNGAISSWVDRIGGLNCVQATGADQPVKSALGVTGDGVSDNLSVSATTGLPTGSLESWIFVVLDQPGGATTKFIFGYGSTGGNGGRRLSKNGSNRLVISNSTVNITDLDHTLTGKHVIAGHWGPGGTVVEGFFDGAPTNPASVAAATNTLTNRTRILSDVNTSPGTFGDATILRIMVFTALSTLWKQKIEGFLAWRYSLTANLAIGHPYKLEPP